ncbi:MAG: UDP-N-acetylmuramoyl-L-alanyl-D-glutamate--2,6-diaminopimelate ligase, partial [Paludibacteraceae bacterium]|nr:UDP-N-acetylmuramoyl-L-alanyl-D-glutamate--2,6-diaminopimelate ligase [Paludibacteraceae bacterium]
MKLADLVEYVSYSQVVGNLQTPVSGITANSKQVTLQGAFVAIKGSQTDGHAYIEAAIQQGASVIVCQKLPQNLHPDVTYLEVTDTNDALGNMAAAFYD